MKQEISDNLFSGIPERDSTTKKFRELIALNDRLGPN
jgi:hypothetical protein